VQTEIAFSDCNTSEISCRRQVLQAVRSFDVVITLAVRYRSFYSAKNSLIFNRRINKWKNVQISTDYSCRKIGGGFGS